MGIPQKNALGHFRIENKMRISRTGSGSRTGSLSLDLSSILCYKPIISCFIYYKEFIFNVSLYKLSSQIINCMWILWLHKTLLVSEAFLGTLSPSKNHCKIGHLRPVLYFVLFPLYKLMITFYVVSLFFREAFKVTMCVWLGKQWED